MEMLGIIHTVGGAKESQIWKENFCTSQLLLKARREHFLIYLQIAQMSFQLIAHHEQKLLHTLPPLS